MALCISMTPQAFSFNKTLLKGWLSTFHLLLKGLPWPPSAAPQQCPAAGWPCTTTTSPGANLATANPFSHRRGHPPLHSLHCHSHTFKQYIHTHVRIPTQHKHTRTLLHSSFATTLLFILLLLLSNLMPVHFTLPWCTYLPQVPPTSAHWSGTGTPYIYCLYTVT